MGLFSNWFKRKHIEDIVDSYTDANGNTDLRGAYDSIKRHGYDSEEDKMFVAGFAAAQKYAALQRQKEQERPVLEVTTTMREIISEYDEEEDSYLPDDEYEDDEYENYEYEDDEYEYEEGDDEDFYEKDEF